jgi:hypothetical protein
MPMPIRLPAALQELNPLPLALIAANCVGWTIYGKRRRCCGCARRAACCGLPAPPGVGSRAAPTRCVPPSALAPHAPRAGCFTADYFVLLGNLPGFLMGLFFVGSCHQYCEVKVRSRRGLGWRGLRGCCAHSPACRTRAGTPAPRVPAPPRCLKPPRAQALAPASVPAAPLPGAAARLPRPAAAQPALAPQPAPAPNPLPHHRRPRT